ncbi:MAG: hypothetical protein AAGA55_04205 [Planctomycetota bacterium]
MKRTRLEQLGAMLAVSAALVGGCASVSPTDGAASAPEARVTFGAEDYATVFNAARDTLADFRFTPDRVDAARGVITTLPKRSAGLASPWDREQSSLGDEARDLVHQHERVVTVVFDPPGQPQALSVDVTIYRVRRPNWRVETDAIRRSTHARNPRARQAGDEPEFREAIRADSALATRIADDLARRAGLVSGG